MARRLLKRREIERRSVAHEVAEERPVVWNSVRDYGCARNQAFADDARAALVLAWHKEDTGWL